MTKSKTINLEFSRLFLLQILNKNLSLGQKLRVACIQSVNDCLLQNEDTLALMISDNKWAPKDCKGIANVQGATKRTLDCLTDGRL